MSFAIKLIIFVVCTGIAFLILLYTEPLVRMIGKMSWAERYLGMGGTYTAWKIIAIVLIFGSLIYLTTAW